MCFPANIWDKVQALKKFKIQVLIIKIFNKKVGVYIYNGFMNTQREKNEHSK